MEEISLDEKAHLYRESQKRFQQFGQLGVTADDHWNIGGSPPIILNRNPGKTLGELMSDQEILAKLDQLTEYERSAKKRLAANPRDDLAKDDLKYVEKELPTTIKYLDSIGRLPDKYKQ